MQRSGVHSRVVLSHAAVSERPAVITLRGEHDASGNNELSAALQRGCGEQRVLVDLTCCEFLIRL
jgi:hypothetical protein